MSVEEFDEITRVLTSGIIDRVAEEIKETMKSGGRVFIAGNGGSSYTANHFASDLQVSWGNPNKEPRVVISLNSQMGSVTALTNDYGWEEVYELMLKSYGAGEGDLLILFSVHGGSGWSANLVRAANYMKSKRGKVISFVGFDGGVLKKISDLTVHIPVESTPLVEGAHCMATHLIADRIRGGD